MMQDAQPQLQSGTNMPPVMPTVSPALLRSLPPVVLGSVVAVAIVSAAVILAMHRPEWWSAFWVGTGVAVLGAITSVLIILRSAGKPADFVITMVMLLSAVRLGVSLVGLMVGVLALKAAPVPTAVIICSYYVVTLFVESFLVSRSLKTQSIEMDRALQGKHG
jgi:hypothetical protein